MKKVKKTRAEIMEEDFARLGGLPKNFDKVVDDLMSETRRIFYKRKGSKAEYHCTTCGRDYTLRTGRRVVYSEMYYEDVDAPSDGDMMACWRCGTKAILKPRRRWEQDRTWRTINVWQVTDKGLVLRTFEAMKIDRIDAGEEIRIKEFRRIFYEMKNVRSYQLIWGYYPSSSYSDAHQHWWSGGTVSESSDACIGIVKDMYKMTPLKYCPLEELEVIFNRKLYTENVSAMYDRILRTYCHFPQIEMEIKMGMEKLAEYHLMRKGVDGRMNKKAKKPADMYKVFPDRLKLLRGCDLTEWHVYQWEYERGSRFTDEEIVYLKDMFKRNYDSYIKKLAVYMSIEQIKNRTEKYKEKKCYESDYSVISHYCDYLAMRAELGYDMTNSVYLYPSNLKRAHDKMVKEKEDRKNELRIQEVLLKYTDIPKKYKSLKRKYGYSAHGYEIRPAKDAGEIVREGWALHHCVGGDTYLKKHNDGKTAILFMRSISSPDKSYVTIEVRGENIEQWYGAHDKKDVTKAARKCIEEFEEKIKRKPRKKKVTEKRSELPVAV
ncbi:MAG: PcfJ domain-containing protein [Eubacterium sp.]|nr:PcfJ domain-containing protein [Eubacterium sp.]